MRLSVPVRVTLGMAMNRTRGRIAMSVAAPMNEPECLDLDEAAPRSSDSQESLLLGLQLCRANTMSLTRLQLALRSGNRRSALEAIDRLHALDARIEHLIERLPPPANE